MELPRVKLLGKGKGDYRELTITAQVDLTHMLDGRSAIIPTVSKIVYWEPMLYHCWESLCPEVRGHYHGRYPGASEGRSGASEGRSGASEGWSGASEGRSGASEGRSGATEGRSGASEGRSGASEGRSGASEGRSGACQEPQRDSQETTVEVAKIRLVHSVILPSQKERVLEAELEIPRTTESDLFFEPAKELRSLGIVAMQSLLIPENAGTTVFVPIANPQGVTVQHGGRI